MPASQRAPTVTQLFWTFVPFAVLGAAAIFLSIGEPAVALARARWLIQLSLVLTIPALVRWVLAVGREPLGNWWRLFWTFGYLAYLSHFWFGFAVLFRGELDSVFQQQGTIVAASNFALTALWGIDVVLAWTRADGGRLIMLFRSVVHVLAFASFLLSAVVFRTGAVRALGVVMTLAVLGAAARRWLLRSM